MMSAIAISLIVFACLFVGALVGMALRNALPEHHLSSESKDVVKVGTGLIGTMAALLLGLLVASAKSSFDTKRDELSQMAAKVVFLNQLLERYGPEAHEAREQLKGAVTHAIDRLWPKAESEAAQLDPSAASGELVFKALNQLTPKNEEHTALKAQALQTTVDIGQIRWLLFAQRESSISTPMLIVVVFWMTAIFMSLGLFAPPNTTVFATVFLCALSVAGAFFLVLELDQPFGGTIQISSGPLRSTLEHLAK